MLAHLGYYAGPITGRSELATREAVATFRTAEGLGAGGADVTMRHKLVEKYLKSPGTSLSAGTRVMHHGCGEYHPATDTSDGEAAAENRRVEVFLFEGPVEPLPPAKCPVNGCSEYLAWKKRVVETIDLNIRRDLTSITVALRDR